MNIFIIPFNTLRSAHSEQHFADNIFKDIFSNEFMDVFFSKGIIDA